MTEVRIPVSCQHRLPYYLALEEWVADNLPDDEYIFSWRVNPTVICGRNQDISLEVNMPYCRANGIDVVRRRSGGGCVYADMNNYMFSYIAPGTDVETNFARYSEVTATMLRSLSIDATVSGRNDILVGGCKIAGNAFYIHGGKSVAHGTMLFDIDAERMGNAITPSHAKLASKSVKSVPSHVTCLRSLGLDMTVEQFGEYAMRYFTDGKNIALTQKQLDQLGDIEKRYYDASFLYGRARESKTENLVRRFRRIEGVGDFYADIELDKESRITRICLYGDFFSTGDISGLIERPLTGSLYDRNALAEAMERINTANAVKGLTDEALLEILI